MRSTSIEAYERIRMSGLLSRMRWRVYRTVYHRGPMTSRELDQALARPGEARTSYHKRLSELERLGVVVVVGQRACRITGMTALLWDVTDALPHRPPERKRCPHCGQLLPTRRT